MLPLQLIFNFNMQINNLKEENFKFYEERKFQKKSKSILNSGLIEIQEVKEKEQWIKHLMLIELY